MAETEDEIYLFVYRGSIYVKKEVTQPLFKQDYIY
jgi:hypothetical protein